MSRTVADSDITDFDDVLDEAESNAKGPWEEQFVKDLRGKYREHGDRMFLSERQEEVIKRIAGW